MRSKAFLLTTLLFLVALPCAAMAVPLAGVSIGEPAYMDTQAAALIESAQSEIDTVSTRLIDFITKRTSESFGPDTGVYHNTDKAVFGQPGTHIVFVVNREGKGRSIDPGGVKSLVVQHVHSSGTTSSFQEATSGLELFLSLGHTDNGHGTLDVAGAVFGRIVSERGYVSFIKRPPQDGYLRDLNVSQNYSVMLLDGRINGASGGGLIDTIESVQRKCGEAAGGHILDLVAAALMAEKVKTGTYKISSPHNSDSIPTPTVLSRLNPSKMAACIKGRW